MPEFGTFPSLYSGSDLDNAVDRSFDGIAPRAMTSTRRTAAVFWASKAAAHHLRRTARSLLMTGCREILCRARAEQDDDWVAIRYVGKSRNLSFLLDSCASEYEILSERRLSVPSAVRALRRFQDEDLFISDAESSFATPAASGLIIPPWIKQRIVLPDHWPQFIGSLPRKVRRELERYLRKYEFQARLNDSEEAFARFYQNFYSPHISARYGDQAVVVDDARFERDRVGTTVIELIFRGEVIGGNVIRIVSDRLHVLWCGLSEQVSDNGIKGATDALDYFSILSAACFGASVVDLGRTRPRLNDGLLRYKAKWGAEVYLGRLNVPPIRIIPRNLHSGTNAMLARNAWIVRRANALEGRVFVNDAPLTQESLERVRSQFWQKGLRRIRVGALQGFAAGLNLEGAARHGVDTVDLSGTALGQDRSAAII